MVKFEATYYDIDTQEEVTKEINFDVEIVDVGDTNFEESCWNLAIIRAMNIIKENKSLTLDKLEFISC